MKIMKPKVYNDFDPTGYWMSEKFDGVRAEWDGVGSFMSKADKLYHVPYDMTVGMPNHPLSGEFYLGRGRFQETVSIVRNQRMDLREWAPLKFLVFELPTVENYTFEDRMFILEGHKFSYPDFVHVVLWVKCQNPSHFESFYENIIERGGEGAVLAKANSLYEFKRSSNQWKRTPTFTAEAIVVDYTAGTGKHEGKVGALVVSDNRKSFKVGTGLSDVERENPPPLGSSITYSYKGLTNAGKPRHPAFLTVRDYE